MKMEITALNNNNDDSIIVVNEIWTLFTANC